MSDDTTTPTHLGNDKKPVSPFSGNPASPTFARPSWSDHYSRPPAEGALAQHIASGELTRTVAKLVAADVLEAGALTPCSIVSEIRRALGEETVERWGLIRHHHALSTPEPATPARWIETILERHPDPSAVLAAALPARPHLFFALRVPLLSMLSHSVAHKRGAVPHLDGEIFLRRWMSVPPAARGAFPAVTHANIKALAHISPQGELQLHRPGGGSYTIDLCHALLLDGQLAGWFAGQMPKANGKSNGVKK